MQREVQHKTQHKTQHKVQRKVQHNAQREVQHKKHSRPQLDILKLQNFVLNKRNIEAILKHTSKVDEKTVIKQPIKRVTKNMKGDLFFKPKFTDALFWCYYIINYGLPEYEMVRGDGFIDSMAEKIKLVENVRENKILLKKNKWKCSIIENDLANEKRITLNTFLCICAIKKHNIIYINDRTLFKQFIFADDCGDKGESMGSMGSSDSTDAPTTNVLNIIKKTDDGYSLFIGSSLEKQNKYDIYRETHWHINSVNAPLGRISSYKIKDLRDICIRLNISIVSTDGKGKMSLRKADLYKLIREYL